MAEDFLKVMTSYQAEQKKKAKAREDFNTKYTEINKKIADELKKEREAKEALVLQAADSKPGAATSNSETAASDFITVELRHAELIEFISSAGMMHSNPFLTEKIVDYVVKKNHDSGHRFDGATNEFLSLNCRGDVARSVECW